MASSMAMKWYVVHTYSGHENKVRAYIENAKLNTSIEDKIGQVSDTAINER